MFKKFNIVTATEKKVVDKEVEIADTDIVPTLAETLQAEQTFTPTIYAYAVYKIGTRKFDLYKVSIDPETNKSVAERLGKNWDSERRAYMEMQLLFAADLVKLQNFEINQNKGKNT